MPKFRVLVHGENLHTKTDGTEERLGFYRQVEVHADTAFLAQALAVEKTRCDPRLHELSMNSDVDAIRISAETVNEVGGDADGETGFILYSEDEDD